MTEQAKPANSAADFTAALKAALIEALFQKRLITAAEKDGIVRRNLS